jgi:two-component system LytT family sensor kinase
MTRRVQQHQDVPSVLDEICAQLAPALSARIVAWHEHAVPLVSPIDETAEGGTAAVVDVPVAEPPHYALTVKALIGGRRLLSDDHAALDAIASLAGRRIDAIRLSDERYARALREREIGKLVTEAELRALRAQINPHFLFNALTTIGYLIQTAPPRALETLMRLTALMRGVLRSEGEFTTLGRELELIEAYLDIEHARFEQRLRVRIDIPPVLRELRVPPLVLQPVVENAVKHGIGRRVLGGELTVTAHLEADGDRRILTIVVHDSGVGASEAELRAGRVGGVGLNNVERRLACQYGDLGSLTIKSVPGGGTTVWMRMPVEDPARRSHLAVTRSVL